MLIFGIDKFMSECRALVNFTGNAVATLFIAWWDRTLDADRVRRVFNGEAVEPLPSEDPHLPDELTRHRRRPDRIRPPARAQDTGPHAALEPAAADSTATDDRRPAYSETI